MTSGFKGMVFHSFDFGSKLGDLIASVPPAGPNLGPKAASVVVVGGGKSAQEWVFPVPEERNIERSFPPAWPHTSPTKGEK